MKMVKLTAVEGTTGPANECIPDHRARLEKGGGPAVRPLPHLRFR